jgi:hypothetical protein
MPSNSCQLASRPPAKMGYLGPYSIAQHSMTEDDTSCRRQHWTPQREQHTTLVNCSPAITSNHNIHCLAHVALH